MRANRKHGGPAGVGISGTVLAPHWAQGLQSGWRARTPTEQLGSSLHPQMPEAVTPQASFKHSPPPPPAPRAGLCASGPATPTPISFSPCFCWLIWF